MLPGKGTRISYSLHSLPQPHAQRLEQAQRVTSPVWLAHNWFVALIILLNRGLSAKGLTTLAFLAFQTIEIKTRSNLERPIA